MTDVMPSESSDPAARQDASRRTLLAEERTFLAWFRSGLAAIAVSLAVGRLLPALVEGDQRVYRLLGIGYGLLGDLLDDRTGPCASAPSSVSCWPGRFLPLPLWVIVTLGVAGLVLSTATVATLLSGA